MSNELKKAEAVLARAEEGVRTAEADLRKAHASLLAAQTTVVAARIARDQAKQAVSATIPVNRDDVTLSDGSPVTPDHRETKPNGLQKGYVVLSDAERAKGFVRPYRDAYKHLKCGVVTTMGRPIAETYARDPEFYNGTYCVKCQGHFPVGKDGEFTWYEMDGTDGPKVGT